MNPRVTDPPARLHPADFFSQLSNPFGVVAVLPFGTDLQEAIDLLKLDVRRPRSPVKEAADQLSPWIREVVTVIAEPNWINAITLNA